MIRLIIISLLASTSFSCVPLLVAGGVGAAAGYYTGKHYNIKVNSPVEVKRKD